MKQLIVGGVDLIKFLGIPYVGRRHPGNVSVEEFLAEPKFGSNCQLFALGVEAYAGFCVKERISKSDRMGSRELWLPNSFTHFVVAEDVCYLIEKLKPFDILFFSPRKLIPKNLKDYTSVSM